MSAGENPLKIIDDGDGTRDDSSLYSAKVPPGMTRNCIDPWGVLFLKANGDVCVCCFDTKIGSLNDNTIDEIVNNQYAKAYREGLLSGDLPPRCINCPEKYITDTETLKKKVIKFLSEGVFDPGTIIPEEV